MFVVLERKEGGGGGGGWYINCLIPCLYIIVPPIVIEYIFVCVCVINFNTVNEALPNLFDLNVHCFMSRLILRMALACVTFIESTPSRIPAFRFYVPVVFNSVDGTFYVQV